MRQWINNADFDYFSGKVSDLLEYQLDLVSDSAKDE